jgi:hypothetical protein
VLRVDLFSLNPMIAHVTYSEAVVITPRVDNTFVSPLTVNGVLFNDVYQVTGVPSQLHFVFNPPGAGPATMKKRTWTYAGGTSAVVARRGNFPIIGLTGKFQ